MDGMVHGVWMFNRGKQLIRRGCHFSETVDIPVDQFEQYGLQSDLFEVALKAFKKAQSTGVTSKTVYTIVDLRMHSKEKRLWTIDLANGELFLNEVTAWLRHSDLDHDEFLDTVSNVPQSKQTSVGLYKTAEVYRESRFVTPIRWIEKVDSMTMLAGEKLSFMVRTMQERSLSRTWQGRSFVGMSIGIE